MSSIITLIGAALLGLQTETTQVPETGSWITCGYGYRLEIEADAARLYEHRALGDLLITTAKRRSAGEAVFVAEGHEPLHLRRHESDGRLVVDWGITSHPVHLVEAEGPAEVPDAESREDPVLNLEWFSASFAEHYAFFETRGVDWQAETARARLQVRSETTPDELFELITSLFLPLEDGHCFLRNERRMAVAGRPDPDPEARRGMGSFQTLIDKDYLEGPLLEDCEGELTAGRLLEGVAYLRLDAMAGLAPKGGTQADLEALDFALDRIFSEHADARGLVIDIRFNGGGDDRCGLRLAERLIGEPSVVVEKLVRADPADPGMLAPVGEFRVQPSTRPGFRGPVVLLVSRHTASAAEVFGMALLTCVPELTVIGERSEGVFSDILAFELPNGWQAGLSNEVYRTPGGECFEGVGLPVDVEIPTLRSEDLAAQQDPALEAAVDLLLSGD